MKGLLSIDSPTLCNTQYQIYQTICNLCYLFQQIYYTSTTSKPHKPSSLFCSLSPNIQSRRMSPRHCFELLICYSRLYKLSKISYSSILKVICLLVRLSVICLKHLIILLKSQRKHKP